MLIVLPKQQKRKNVYVQAQYFGQLRTVVLEFLTPIQETNVLSSKQIGEVFLNIEQLLQVAPFCFCFYVGIFVGVL
jgi:hypothetical protein